MSDERVKRIVSSAPARPTQSSIMSAPRDKKKAERNFLIIVALVISLAANIIIAVISLSKNERMNQLESEIDDQKKLNTELKERLSKMSGF